MSNPASAKPGLARMPHHRPGEDNTAAASMLERAEDYAEGHRLPVDVEVAGVQGATRPVEYSFQNKHITDTFAKARLAGQLSQAGATANVEVGKADVEAYKKEEANRLLQAYDRWCMGQYDIRVPGQLAQLKIANPGLLDRLERGLTRKYDLIKNIEKVTSMAPQDESESFLRFMLDQGAFPEYSLAAQHIRGDIRSDSTNSWDSFIRLMDQTGPNLFASSKRLAWGEEHTRANQRNATAVPLNTYVGSTAETTFLSQAAGLPAAPANHYLSPVSASQL